LLAFLLFPWLTPYTAGPTSNAWPWLLSALCVVVVWWFRRGLTAKRVGAAWLAAAALSALIGLVQYFGLAPDFNSWISQTGPGEAFANLRQRNQFATLTSIGLAALIGWLALRERAPGPMAAPATLQPNLLDRQVNFSASKSPLAQAVPAQAAIDSIAKIPCSPQSMAATQAGAASGPSPHPPSRWRMPWWAYVLAGLLALGNAASGSRTGLLQWLLITALAAVWFWPTRRSLLAFAVQALLAYGLVVLALPWLLEWTTGLQSGGLFGRLVTSNGCSSRTILWSNVLTLIMQKPWLGWGWGELDYAHFMTLYDGPRFCEILDNAHNLPLHLAVELGVPVAVTVCGALSWGVWRGKPWRETDPMRQMAWGVLAVIGLHSLLEYPLWYGPFQIATGLSVALLCGGLNGARQPASPGAPENRQKTRLAQWLRGLVALLLIAAIAGAAFSYHRVSQLYLQPAQRSPAYREDTLAKVRDTWLFRDQARFAELSLTALTPDNAADVHAMAVALLHYSPEPRVVEKLIESAVLLGRDAEALQYLARYRAAFPEEHARWVAKNGRPSASAAPAPGRTRRADHGASRRRAGNGFWASNRPQAQAAPAPAAMHLIAIPAEKRGGHACAAGRSGGRPVPQVLAATKLPDLPPCFSSSFTSVIAMPRSAALHMS